jgi:UMF1 family MFS transporter
VLTSKAEPIDRRAVVAWCLYDWANSAFPTVIVTFVFATYFTTRIAESPESGTSQWGLMMSLSGLAIALISPVLGAIADRGGRRKPWILAFSCLCILAGASLWWMLPEGRYALIALLLVGIANAAFEIATVFYNAMLPDVAPPGRIGRISGWAWGAGYAGGLACLGLSLLCFVLPEPPLFGLDQTLDEQMRITSPFVALWFVVFALPMFFLTPDRPSRRLSPRRALREGLASLRQTLRGLPKQRQILTYLIARMLYTDGLNTIFAFGGIYAAGTFGMDFQEILAFGILLNVTAGLGAAGFAWVDDWIGPKRTILVSVAALFLLGAGILLVESKLWFYLLGGAIGTFIGPIQSSSRSFMAHLAPEKIRTELFGLYALSGKVTAFIGPALVGAVTLATGSQRWGLSTVLLLLISGWVLLLWVRDPSRQ